MTAIGNALVVGAGIGGLTAAIALRRQGIAVDLVEVEPRTTVYGVGIIQPNNTLRALDRIGLAKACTDAGAAFPGWRIHDPAGVLLMEALGTNDAAPAYPANNGITRPKLHEILIAAAADHGVPIEFGCTVETLEDRGDAVAVKLTTGRQASYDLVVGCDGMFSPLRTRLFGRQDIRFTGQGVWRYNLPRPVDLEWGALFIGPKSKVGLVPLSPTLMYMLVVAPEPGNPRFEGDQMASEMRARLAGFTGLVAELGEQIVDPAAVVYRPMETLLLPAPWNKGRIILIGDAAHSTTPHLAQGAAMAIEDAVLLGELMGRDAPVEELLGEFMQRRFDRAKFVVDSSLQIGAWEMDEWNGIHDPEHNPGALLHRATLELMSDY